MKPAPHFNKMAKGLVAVTGIFACGYGLLALHHVNQRLKGCEPIAGQEVAQAISVAHPLFIIADELTGSCGFGFRSVPNFKIK